MESKNFKPMECPVCQEYYFAEDTDDKRTYPFDKPFKLHYNDKEGNKRTLSEKANQHEQLVKVVKAHKYMRSDNKAEQRE